MNRDEERCHILDAGDRSLSETIALHRLLWIGRFTYVYTLSAFQYFFVHVEQRWKKRRDDQPKK